MWIVTRFENDYNQHGEYFVAAYTDKPEFKDLKALLPDEDDVTVGKLTRGFGGDISGTSYALAEYENGQECK